MQKAHYYKNDGKSGDAAHCFALKQNIFRIDCHRYIYIRIYATVTQFCIRTSEFCASVLYSMMCIKLNKIN